MRSLVAGIVFAAIIASSELTFAQEIQILHVRGNVYLLSGAGGNIALSIGRKDG